MVGSSPSEEDEGGFGNGKCEGCEGVAANWELLGCGSKNAINEKNQQHVILQTQPKMATQAQLNLGMYMNGLPLICTSRARNA